MLPLSVYLEWIDTLNPDEITVLQVKSEGLREEATVKKLAPVIDQATAHKVRNRLRVIYKKLGFYDDKDIDDYLTFAVVLATRKGLLTGHKTKDQPPSLSVIEKPIASLIVCGLSIKEIATTLQIDEYEALYYLRSMYSKYKIRSKQRLAAFIIANDLL